MYTVIIFIGTTWDYSCNLWYNIHTHVGTVLVYTQMHTLLNNHTEYHSMIIHTMIISGTTHTCWYRTCLYTNAHCWIHVWVMPILDSEFQNCHNKGNSVPLHMPWTHAQKNSLEQHNYFVISDYSGTSLIRTHLGPFEVSSLWRCPRFQGLVNT